MRYGLIAIALLALFGCGKAPPRGEAKDTGSVAGEVPDRPAPLGSVPADVPVYPGATLVGTFSAPGNGADGQPGASQYEFNTPDSPAKVMSYYHEQMEKPGMKVALHTDTKDGGMFVAEDDARHRTVNVIVEKSSDATAIRVTIRPKA